MIKKVKSFSKKDKKKFSAKKIDVKKESEKKKEILEEKSESLENQIEETQDEISDAGFKEFLEPIKKSGVVLDRIAVSRDGLENQIAGIPGKRENEQDRIVRYGENKSDYSPANSERRKNPENMGYVAGTATYSSIQKKEEEGRMHINPVKNKWETRRKRTDPSGMEVGSFDRIEREKQEKKYLEKGAQEYYN